MTVSVRGGATGAGRRRRRGGGCPAGAHGFSMCLFFGSLPGYPAGRSCSQRLVHPRKSLPLSQSLCMCRRLKHTEWVLLHYPCCPESVPTCSTRKDRNRDTPARAAHRRYLEEREREKELELIKQQYLGLNKPKKRVIRPSEKFKFNFDWSAEEDTSKDLNPLYATPHGVWASHVLRLFLAACHGFTGLTVTCYRGGHSSFLV